jgi:hypothetical protein
MQKPDKPVPVSTRANFAKGKSILLEIPLATHRQLVALKEQYRSELNTTATVSFLIRLAIDQFIPREQERMHKAKAGCLHAKKRK